MEDQFGENSQLKEFQCPVCLKQFSRKFTLDMHLLIHKGVKPHPCPFCGKCFRQKGTLMRHKALHSSNNLFHCSLCDRGFRQKNVFLHHLKHRHNVSTETLDRRKYRTELKDYQSIMDTLPPFVHADSTAIASSEKHLDAMLFESFNTSVCDSSGTDGTSEQIDTIRSGSQNEVYSTMQIGLPNLRTSEFSEISDNGFKEYGYECSFCLKMYLEYDQYKQHVEETHGNEEMLLECKPILLQSRYPDKTAHLDDESRNKEELSQKPKSVNVSSNNIPLQNNFNGVSSSNDVNECIPCQKNFRTSEEFECHVKSHVQSVLLNDCETNEDVKPVTLIPSSFQNTSDKFCDNAPKISCSTSENVSQPLMKSAMTKAETLNNGVCNIRNPQTSLLIENFTKSNANLSPTLKSHLHKQREFPDSASSHVNRNGLAKKIKSPSFIHNKQFLYEGENESNTVNATKHISFDHNRNLYKCKQCRKSYRSELSFEYHLQMHLSSKSFNCGYCKKRFSTKQLLLSHTRSSHMKSFCCPSCSRLFHYRTLYFQHKKHCCKTSSNFQNFKNVSLPLVDIQKLLNSDTNGIIGVIPVSDLGNSNGVKSKIGIPIISLSSIKNISSLPLLDTSIEINGVLK